MSTKTLWSEDRESQGTVGRKTKDNAKDLKTFSLHSTYTLVYQTCENFASKKGSVLMPLSVDTVTCTVSKQGKATTSQDVTKLWTKQGIIQFYRPQIQFDGFNFIVSTTNIHPLKPVLWSYTMGQRELELPVQTFYPIVIISVPSVQHTLLHIRTHIVNELFSIVLILTIMMIMLSVDLVKFFCSLCQHLVPTRGLTSSLSRPRFKGRLLQYPRFHRYRPRKWENQGSKRKIPCYRRSSPPTHLFL